MSKTLTPQKRWILVALMLTMMLAAMDITIVSTVIPQIVTDLGGFSKFTWVFSIYLLTQTVTIPIYGKLSDIYGRKSILIFGIVIFLIGSLASAFSWNIYALIAFRGIQGIGAGSIMATVNTIAGDIFSVRERARIQGYLSSIWGISAILGPTLGGALTEFINWRWIFLINLPIGAISIFFLLRFFKEKVERSDSTIDYKGALLIVSSIGLFLLFLMEGGQSWAWISWQSGVLFGAFVVLSIMTYRFEKKSKDAIMPFWIWRNKSLIFTNLAMIGMGIVTMGPETLLPTFTQTSLGLGVIASGLVLASMSIGWPTASALSGRLYLKIGFRETSLIGAALVLIACFIFVILPRPQSISWIVFDLILMGAGFGLLSTPSLVGAQSMVDWHHRGVVTSSVIFCRNLGQSVGATIVGTIFNNSLRMEMKNSPMAIATDSSKDLLHSLQSTQISETVKEFIRTSINSSMINVFIGLIFFAGLTFLFMYLVPHRKPGDLSLIDIEELKK